MTDKKGKYKKTLSLLAVLLLVCSLYADGKHKVQPGETFYSISRKYGLSIDELCAANGVKSTDLLKAGQDLVIPEKSSAKAAAAPKQEEAPKPASPTATTQESKAAARSPAPAGATADTTKESKSATAMNRKFDTYTVQKGDTLYRIAQVNGITVDELKALNDLEDASLLKTGQKLKIPVTIVDTATASLPALPKALPESDPRKYSAKKGDSTLAWPVQNPTVTYTSGKVSGVQLSAQKNENVTAIRAGTVMYVGNYRGYGQVVFVQSKTGHVYVYSGLGSIKVQKGDYVVFGDSIGTAGTDSINGADQICLMVFQKSAPIDPATAPRG